MKKTAVILVPAIVVAVVVAVIVHKGSNKGVPFRLIYTARDFGYLVRIEESKGGLWLGGFDRRATAIQKAKAENPRSFVVNGGGFFAYFRFGTLAYREVLSKFAIKGMNETGVEVSNIDVADQMWGKEKLQEYASLADFPFISACLVDAETGEYAFEPFKIIEKDGLKVAFVGIMDRSAIDERNMSVARARSILPPGIEQPTYEDLPREGEGYRVLSLNDAFRRVTPLLKGKADAVVVLSSGGSSVWRALAPYEDGSLYSVGLGVTGKAYDKPLIQGRLSFVLTGLGGAYLGIVDCNWRSPGDVILEKWDPVKLTKDVKGDPKLSGLVTEMRKSLADVDPTLLVDKIYEPPEGLSYVGAETCSRCHQAEYNIWKQTNHAHPLDSLKRDNAQYDPKCLACHVGDYFAVDGYLSEKQTPEMTQISCEICHGRGSRHVELGGRDPEALLTSPDPPRCLICHDYINDPDFDYAKCWQRIQHGHGRTPVRTPEPQGPAAQAVPETSQ